MRPQLLAVILAASFASACSSLPSLGPGSVSVSLSDPVSHETLVPTLPTENAVTAAAFVTERAEARAQVAKSAPVRLKAAPAEVAAPAQQDDVTPGTDVAEILPSPSKRPADALFMGEDGLPGIWDVIDTINPLHHFPIVGGVYREVSGDRIGLGARVGGDVLYWGPLGLVMGAVDFLFIETTGKDLSTLAFDFFKREEEAGEGADLLVAFLP